MFQRCSVCHLWKMWIDMGFITNFQPQLCWRASSMNFSFPASKPPSSNAPCVNAPRVKHTHSSFILPKTYILCYYSHDRAGARTIWSSLTRSQCSSGVQVTSEPAVPFPTWFINYICAPQPGARHVNCTTRQQSLADR